jgi:HEAT repeat protein
VQLLHLDQIVQEKRAREGGVSIIELSVKVREQIAQGLGDMQTYAALRPLERIYEDPDPRVRRAAILALRYLCYKRTFQLVLRGLRDADDGVREAALRSMKDLHFPHAVDPLIRIFREYDDPRVKIAALESLGRVGDVCAGEFLIDVLRHEAEPLQEVARRLLMNYDNADILPILRRHHEIATGRARELLQGVLRGR